MKTEKSKASTVHTFLNRAVFIALMLVAVSAAGLAQGVAINETNANPDASAILDLASATKGFLAPRMTATARAAITSPATGLLVYQTDGTTGFYFYTGSVWQHLGGSNLSGSGSSGQLTFWDASSGLAGDNSFVWDNTNKGLGIGTASPNAALHIAATGTQDGNFLATGDYGLGAGIPATGAGSRMMWYPRKTAFRAGLANGWSWDDANIGAYSLATGAATIASGVASTALGNHTTASGASSTAMGDNTSATGFKSVAIGTSCVSSGNYTTAMGSITTASGAYSTAMGAYVSTDSKDGAFVIGDQSTTTTMNASATNQMSMRFDGGYRLFSNTALTDGLFLSSAGNVGLGVPTPTNKLEVAGQVKITGGSPGAGKVLTSDANGVATWETPAASGSTLDAAYDFGGAGSGRTITADAGAVTVAGVDGFLATGTHSSGTIPATGQGSRMMWYPKKSAFRAGYVSSSKWDDASTGEYSIAMGREPRASGESSVAIGYGTIAAGDYSTAMGYATQATGDYSTAIGVQVYAHGAFAFAVGNNNWATGGLSTAMGKETTASGDFSTAMGTYTSTNSKKGAFVIGDQSTTTVMNASATNEMSMRFDGGYRLFSNTALTDGLFITSSGNVGLGVTAPTNKLEVAGQVKITGGTPGAGKVLTSDANGLATWQTPAASGGTLDAAYDFGGSGSGRTITADAGAVTVAGTDGLLVSGTQNAGTMPATGSGTRMMFYPKKSAFRAGLVNGTQWDDTNVGDKSIAMGENTIASGDNSFAIGKATTASGDFSTALGSNTTASGSVSTAIGGLSIASNTYSIATGYGTVASGPTSTAMGWITTASGSYSTAMGSSASTNDKDGAFVIGDGSTNTVMNASNANEMSMRFDGGYRLFSNATLTDGLFITSAGNVGIGVTAPTNKLEVAGQVKITGGTPGAGKVLTSDANGLATWLTPAAGGGTLNAAYDFGGSGIGRQIDADAGAVTIAGVDGFVATGYLTYGTIPATGMGARMMWYPKKVAFRAGYVNGTEWDDANIGAYSIATGNGTVASGSQSTAMGLGTTASGQASTAMGSNTVASGSFSTALGNYTSTNGKTGAFVIGDYDTHSLESSADHQMSMRFRGGYRLYSNNSLSTGVYMNGGASGWTNYSDRNKKENFTEIDGEELLGKIRHLPVTEWNYKDTDPSIRYIGPMAQDFWQAFRLGGTDSLGINSIAIDGVNLAAIKALERRTAELKSRTAELESVRAELAAVKAELTTLQAMQTRLEALETAMTRMQDVNQETRTVQMVDNSGRR